VSWIHWNDAANSCGPTVGVPVEIFKMRSSYAQVKKIDVKLPPPPPNEAGPAQPPATSLFGGLMADPRKSLAQASKGVRPAALFGAAGSSTGRKSRVNVGFAPKGGVGR
jgi:hypothetical protein